MAANILSISVDSTLANLRERLDAGENNHGVKFIQVNHRPDTPADSNLILMARRDPQSRTCLVELAKLGYYVYTSADGVTKLVRSDHIKDFWLSLKGVHYKMSKREVLYTFSPPLEGRKPKRMLVVFSSMYTEANTPSLQRYFMQNFKTVQKFLPSDTAVLRIGDLGGVVGSFYLNNAHRPNNAAAVQKLITRIRTKHEIDHDAVVLYGASKGGTGAMYHGILGDYRFVSVDPILSDDHYVKSMNDAHFTVGGIFPETKDQAFERLFIKMRSNIVRSKTHTRSALIYSERSPQFPYINKSVVQRFAGGIACFNSLDPRIKDHPDVSPKTLNCATMLMNMQLYGLNLAPGVRTLD